MNSFGIGESTGGMLPDGTVTRSDRKYVREWRAFAEPLKKALGAELHAFDPDVALAINGRVETFSNGVVWRLNKALGMKR